MKKPNFFIVGAPKSGTTALYIYLRQHPDIFMPGCKEPHFFGTDFDYRHPRFTEKRYLSLFAAAGEKKRIGEASTWYLYSKLAAAEIKEFCPDAKIIIMLREPVGMLYSLHSQLVYSRDEEIVDFRAALAAEETRKIERIKQSGNLSIECLFYREIIKYADQVKRYFDIFKRENVRVIIFDDFTNDIARVYKETLHFLGVNEDFKAEFKVINPNREFKNKWLQDILIRPSRAKRWLDKISFLKIIHNQIRDGLMRINTRHTIRKALDREFKRRLKKEFAPEVERLGRLIGVDLAYWSND